MTSEQSRSSRLLGARSGSQQSVGGSALTTTTRVGTPVQGHTGPSGPSPWISPARPVRLSPCPFSPLVNVLHKVLPDDTQPESHGKFGTLGLVSLTTTPGDPVEAAAGLDRLQNSSFSVVGSPREWRGRPGSALLLRLSFG